MNRSQALFITGNPRSGTTLLRLILTTHSEIVVPPECGFILHLYPRYQNWELTDAFLDHRVQSFINDLYACRKFETWKLPRRILENKIKYHADSYDALVKAVITAYASMFNKNPLFLGDKNNYYVKHLQELKKIIPESYYIFIVRDPRDVACSYRDVMRTQYKSIYRPSLPYDALEIAQEWKHNTSKIFKHMKLNEERTFLIRYEDLTSNPPLILKELCRFLGTPYEKAMLSFYSKSNDDASEPAETIDWKKMTTQPISKKSVGQHKRILNDKDREVIEDICNDEMISLGY